MERYIGAGDKVKVKSSYFTNGYRIEKGTEFEITFVDKGTNTPYCCRCLILPVTLWLKRDQFDVIE